MVFCITFAAGVSWAKGELRTQTAQGMIPVRGKEPVGGGFLDLGGSTALGLSRKPGRIPWEKPFPMSLRMASHSLALGSLVEPDMRVTVATALVAVSYTHLRAHETDSYLVCRLLLEKKK